MSQVKQESPELSKRDLDPEVLRRLILREDLKGRAFTESKFQALLVEEPTLA